MSEDKKEAKPKAEKSERGEKPTQKADGKSEGQAEGGKSAGKSEKAAKGAEGAEKSAAPEKVVKKKSKRNVSHGHCYINAGFGNTIITVTDGVGGTLAWSTSGRMGFKGSRKGTPFAAQVAAEDVVKKAFENGVRSVN